MKFFCTEKINAGKQGIAILICVFVLISLVPVFALTESDQLIQSLKPQGFVSDFANVFPARQKQNLDHQLQSLKTRTGIEIAVVSLHSMRGGQIDDFANRLFEHWGIGKKGQDNGVLLLAVINDRKMRIEVGYGLEGKLTDAAAGRIRDADIVPYFKKGDYAKGLTRGALTIANQVGNGSFTAEGIPAQKVNHSKVSVLFKGVIFLVFIMLFIRNPFLAMLLLSGGRTGGGSGGFGGGGFGGFGGGMSGGGGASGGW